MMNERYGIRLLDQAIFAFFSLTLFSLSLQGLTVVYVVATMAFKIGFVFAWLEVVLGE